MSARTTMAIVEDHAVEIASEGIGQRGRDTGIRFGDVGIGPYPLPAVVEGDRARLQEIQAAIGGEGALDVLRAAKQRLDAAAVSGQLLDGLVREAGGLPQRLGHRLLGQAVACVLVERQHGGLVLEIAGDLGGLAVDKIVVDFDLLLHHALADAVAGDDDEVARGGIRVAREHHEGALAKHHPVRIELAQGADGDQTEGHAAEEYAEARQHPRPRLAPPGREGQRAHHRQCPPQRIGLAGSPVGTRLALGGLGQCHARFEKQPQDVAADEGHAADLHHALPGRELVPGEPEDHRDEGDGEDQRKPIADVIHVCVPEVESIKWQWQSAACGSAPGDSFPSPATGRSAGSCRVPRHRSAAPPRNGQRGSRRSVARA